MATDREPSRDKGFSVNDQRWWLHAETDLDALAAGANGSHKPTYVEQLEKQLSEKEDLFEKFRQANRESQTELEQIRERLVREREACLDVERAKLAEPFVEILENLQRLVSACENASQSDSLVHGASLVVNQLEERLKQLGLETIKAEGQDFDPANMEAMLTTEVEPQQDGKVLEVVRPGYELKGRVVRPAGVRVGVCRRS